MEVSFWNRPIWGKAVDLWQQKMLANKLYFGHPVPLSEKWWKFCLFQHRKEYSREKICGKGKQPQNSIFWNEIQPPEPFPLARRTVRTSSRCSSASWNWFYNWVKEKWSGNLLEPMMHCSLRLGTPNSNILGQHITELSKWLQRISTIKRTESHVVGSLWKCLSALLWGLPKFVVTQWCVAAYADTDTKHNLATSIHSDPISLADFIYLLCIYVSMYLSIYACMHAWMYVCMSVCIFLLYPTNEYIFAPNIAGMHRDLINPPDFPRFSHWTPHEFDYLGGVHVQSRQNVAVWRLADGNGKCTLDGQSWK